MAQVHTIYEFLGFRADVANGLLHQNGSTVALTPKAFDTLVVLLKNHNELVGKDELMAAVWPNRFVEESNITFNIKTLRKALGDSVANPRFIETVPRRGYRFIAPVTETNGHTHLNGNSDISNGQIASTQLESRFSKSVSRRLLFAAAIIALMGVVAFGVWSWRQNSIADNAPILTNELSSTKLSETGKVYFAEISPDGKYVAYVSEVNGKQSLWLRHLATSSNTEIVPTNDEKYFGLAFSRDSGIVFFVRRSPEQNLPTAIYSAPLTGGVPFKIADDTQGWISVSPDDKQIAFIRYTSDYRVNQLWLIDVDGKNGRVVRTSEDGNVFWIPSFSPDGKKIAVTYGHTNGASQNITLQEVDVATGEMRELTSERYFNVGDIDWSPDQSTILFPVARTLGEPNQIAKLDYATGKVELLNPDGMRKDKLSLDGKWEKLVAVAVAADFNLYVNEVGGSAKPTMLTQARDELAFTVDGRIVYASDAAGSEDLWISNIDGSNVRQLTTDKGLDAYPLISPDRRYIYFVSNRTGAMQVWRMHMDGSAQTQISKGEGGFPVGFSPDGNWVYFLTAHTRRLLMANESGNENLVFDDKQVGYRQAISPDGDRMAFLRKLDVGSYDLSVMSLSDRVVSGTYSVPKSKEGVPLFLNWLRDGRSVSYSYRNATGSNALWIQALGEKEPKETNDLGPGVLLDCEISPDGKYVAFIRGEWKHDAMLFTGLR